METDNRKTHENLNGAFPKQYDSLFWLGLAIGGIVVGVATLMLPFVFIIMALAVVFCICMALYTAVRERQLYLLLLNIGFIFLLACAVYAVHHISVSGTD